MKVVLLKKEKDDQTFIMRPLLVVLCSFVRSTLRDCEPLSQTLSVASYPSPAAPF